MLLHSRDYHALWVNGAALRAAGVTRATPDPPGGRIERDAAGEPTGVVREHAVRLFAPQLAAAVRGADAERLDAAVRWLHAQGDHGGARLRGPRGDPASCATFGADPGPAPPARASRTCRRTALDAALALGLTSGAGDEWFRHGAVKLFADGTLGSRTAALLEPYEGSDGSGMELASPAELARTAARAAAGGPGRRRSTPSGTARSARRSTRSRRPRRRGRGRRCRSRIEHAQLVDPADLPRFARLGAWASMQPAHCVSDIELAERGWGARVARSYPWRALLDAGATLAVRLGRAGRAAAARPRGSTRP